MAPKKIPHLSVKDFKSQLELSGGMKIFPHAILVKESGHVAKSAGDEGLIRTFVISTAAVDRDNDSVSVDGWDLKNFIKGGSVLWAHGYDSQPGAGQVPIAKPLATWVESGKLMSRAEFTPKEVNPFGYMVHQLLSQGFVRGVSVGFRPIDFDVADDREGFQPLNFKSQELLEYSVTPIPSNPEALDQARSIGIDVGPLKTWIEYEKDNGLATVGSGDLDVAYRCVTKSVTVQVAEQIAEQPATEKEPMTARKQLETLLESLSKDTAATIADLCPKFLQLLEDVVFAKSMGVVPDEVALKQVQEKLNGLLGNVQASPETPAVPVEAPQAEDKGATLDQARAELEKAFADFKFKTELQALGNADAY